jgi:hypothetical protein
MDFPILIYLEGPVCNSSFVISYQLCPQYQHLNYRNDTCLCILVMYSVFQLENLGMGKNVIENTDVFILFCLCHEKRLSAGFFYSCLLSGLALLTKICKIKRIH